MAYRKPATGKNMFTIGVVITPEQRDYLERRAREDERTMASYMRLLLAGDMRANDADAGDYEELSRAPSPPARSTRARRTRIKRAA